jgi:hypothetical protein
MMSAQMADTVSGYGHNFESLAAEFQTNVASLTTTDLTITYSGGPHLLMVHLGPLPGTEPPDSRGDYGYALYRGIMPQGGATLELAASVKHYLTKEPLSGKDLLPLHSRQRLA